MNSSASQAERCCLGMTTFKSTEEARAVVRQLLAEKLIACGTLLPGAESHYLWDGQPCAEAEVVVLLKTTVASQQFLITRICELHSYELPELIFFPIENGLLRYLEWISGSVSENPKFSE